MAHRAASSASKYATTDPDDLLEIGRVGKTHGVRGEVKVLPVTDDPTRFEGLTTVFVGPTAADAVARAVASVRYQHGRRGTTVLLKLDGIDGREAGETLRHAVVYARSGDLPPLGDDEFFLHDLVGLHVATHEGDDVGVVRDLLELPSHPVVVVAREGQANVMIPLVPAFIDVVDLDGGRLVVRPIEGLLD